LEKKPKLNWTESLEKFRNQNQRLILKPRNNPTMIFTREFSGFITATLQISKN
jgi:hypothetical protein